jgi:hypothetical protein
VWLANTKEIEMAVDGQISPDARAENSARDELSESLRTLHYIAGGDPKEAISKYLNALDRYIEVKLRPRRY